MPNFPGYNQYLSEINQAELARSSGNEGKARVCVRRAASLLIRDYLRKRGIITKSNNIYTLLKAMQSLPGIPEEVQIVTNHFVMRINPNGTLPEDVDLIADVRWLEENLQVIDPNEI